MDQNDDPEFLKFLAGFGLDGFYTNLTDDQRQELTQKGETHGPLPRAGRAITKYALPPVFLLGVVGNLLSILVLARYGVRRSSTAFYLFVLSCLDLVSLLAGVPVLFLADVFELVVRNKSNLMCKLQPFATYILTQYAAWVIVAVTVDRLIWIALPFRAKQLCTIRVSGTVLLALFVVLCALNAYLPVTHELQPEYRDNPNSDHVCVPVESFAMLSTWMPWLDVVLFAGVPFVLITLANAVIIFFLRRYGRVHRRLKKNVLAPKRSNAAAAAGTVENKVQTSRSSTPQRDSARDRSLTLMLLTISILFIVSNLPVTTLNIMSALLQVNTKESTTATRVFEKLKDDKPKGMKLDETFMFLRSLFSFLVYLNISCHFLMFIFSGKLFRHEFMQLLNSCPFARKCCHVPIAWVSRHSSFSRKTSCESLAVIANGGAGERSIPLLDTTTCTTSAAYSCNQSNGSGSGGIHRKFSPSTLHNNSSSNFDNCNMRLSPTTPTPNLSRNSSANSQTMRHPSVIIYVPASSGSRAARSVSAVLAPNNLNCAECSAAAVAVSDAASASRATSIFLTPKDTETAASTPAASTSAASTSAASTSAASTSTASTSAASTSAASNSNGLLETDL